MRNEIREALVKEWQEVLDFSEGRQVRLKAYAKMRLSKLSVAPSSINDKQRERLDKKNTYDYKVDRLAESKKARRRLVESGKYFPRQNWQPHEIDFLHRHYKNMKVLDIAHKLGRSYESVMHKMNRLGLEINKRWAK